MSELYEVRDEAAESVLAPRKERSEDFVEDPPDE